MFPWAWQHMFEGRMLAGVGPLYLFELLSHRVLRYTSGLLHVVLLASSIALAGDGLVYQVALGGAARVARARRARPPARARSRRRHRLLLLPRHLGDASRRSSATCASASRRTGSARRACAECGRAAVLAVAAALCAARRLGKRRATSAICPRTPGSRRGSTSTTRTSSKRPESVGRRDGRRTACGRSSSRRRTTRWTQDIVRRTASVASSRPRTRRDCRSSPGTCRRSTDLDARRAAVARGNQIHGRARRAVRLVRARHRVDARPVAGVRNDASAAALAATARGRAAGPRARRDRAVAARHAAPAVVLAALPVRAARPHRSTSFSRWATSRTARTAGEERRLHAAQHQAASQGEQVIRRCPST